VWAEESSPPNKKGVVETPQWRAEGARRCHESTQQKTIINLIAKQKLLLDSVDAWLLTRPLIDRPSKALIPIVRERQTLADSLARYRGQLGLERRSKIKTLKELLEDEADAMPRRY
jgi:hypothetical protein